MVLNKTAIETMEKRKSVRTYSQKKILGSDIGMIQKYLDDADNLVGPFGNTGRIEFVQVNNNITDKGIKLGTYGFIKNPQAYLVGIATNEKKAILEFGYIFHKLVLFLTELGIGTCWMGGTFTRNSFEKEINLAKGEFIPCITPIGYPSDKQGVVDKAIRFVSKANNRKAWEELFLATSFESTLSREDAGDLAKPIEMVRIGPSASNKQPWRLLLSPDRKVCHFYLEHTPNYGTKLGYDMQLLDMGIAMCQFELACMELNIPGKWVTAEPKLTLPNELTEYMVSWSMD